jgi:hypothetical protein
LGLEIPRQRRIVGGAKGKDSPPPIVVELHSKRDGQALGVVRRKARHRLLRKFLDFAAGVLGSVVVILLFACFVWWFYDLFGDISEPNQADSPKVWSDEFERAARAAPVTQPRRENSLGVMEHGFAGNAGALTNLSR